MTGMVPITSLEGQGTQQSEGGGKVWIKKEEQAAYAGGKNDLEPKSRKKMCEPATENRAVRLKQPI